MPIGSGGVEYCPIHVRSLCVCRRADGPEEPALRNDATSIVRELMATDRLDSRGTATGWGRGDVATHPENQEWPFAAFSFVDCACSARPRVFVTLYLWLQTMGVYWVCLAHLGWSEDATLLYEMGI